MAKYLVLLLLNVFLYFLSPTTMHRGYMALLVIIALISVVIFSREKLVGKGIKKIKLRHSILFVVAFIIVFYQYKIDYILGVIDKTDSSIWYDYSVVCSSLALSNIALVSLFLGYFFRIYNEKYIRYSNYFDRHDYSFIMKLICTVGYILLFLFVYLARGETLSRGYVESHGAVDPYYFIIVVLQSVLISVFVLYSVEYKKQRVLGWFKFFEYPIVLVFLYIVVVLLTGRRTEAIRVGCLLLIAYIYCKGIKIKYRRILIIGVISAVVVAMVGIMRSDTAMGVDSGFENLKGVKSISPPTQELAGSVNTLHIATYHYPKLIDYNYGTTFFPSFSILVPGSDFILSMIIPNLSALKSNVVITNLYWKGGNVYYGLGSSILADIYISFGPVGIFLIFVLLGILLRYLETSTFKKVPSPYILALSFGCYSQFVYGCRTGVAVLFLSWTYACVIIYISRILVKRK